MSGTATSSTSTSAAAAAATGANNNNSSSSSSSFYASLGLPVTIAVAIGFLVLLAALLLVSYVCCRAASRSPRPPTTPADGLALPRIIFVAEDDDDSDDDDVENGRDHAAVAGLDQAAISSYPKFPFSVAKAGDGGDTVCSICLCEYREGEMLRMIPDCRHCFHLLCIDVWLRLNASCPVCRTSPLPTPVSTPISTPLSELAPLSRYAADRWRR